MKPSLKGCSMFFALIAGLALVAGSASAQIPAITTPDKLETRLGTLEFKDGAPS